MFRDRAVSLLLVGSLLWLAACTTYTRIELAEVPDHEKVRVTLTDGETVTLRDPWVEDDSIKARKLDGSASHFTTTVHAIPLDQVAEIGLRRTNTGGTVALIIAAIPVAAVAAYLVYCAGWDDEYCP